MAKPKQDEETVINLDSFAIPIAIIVVGVIIAVLVTFTKKDTNQVDTTSPSKETVTSDTGTSEEFEKASTVLRESPYIGDKSKAKVAVVEFSDFQCGYCKRHAEQVYPELKTKYVDKGEIIYVFKSFPLSDSGLSYNAALAAECVAKSVKGDEFGAFFEKMFDITSDAEIRSEAEKAGLKASDYEACIASQEIKDKLAANKEDGSNAGVQGTPGFVVGKIGDDGKVDGVLIRGAYPLADFERAIAMYLE